jgi:NAD+ diphosphatase
MERGQVPRGAMERANFYAASGLDRSAHRRRETTWIAERLGEGSTRIIPVWRTRNFVGGEADAPRAAHLSVARALELGVAEGDLVLLGVEGETAVFAADLSALEEETLPGLLGSEGGFEDLRAVGPLVPPGEAGILAYARALLWWHARHRFCGVCGSPAESADAGHVRRCADPACGAQHFPRTDPAVIMLVHDGGDRALLGRQSRFPPGMYSTLAGFVEPGESLEDAVAREVLEEAGVHLTDIRYHSSQPWPFPASIMLGFTAQATDFEIRIDRDELEDARWFGRAELLAAIAEGVSPLPRADSIARRLVEHWLYAR